jgi:CubicO group peptidase (beta-lactamase class C family)
MRRLLACLAALLVLAAPALPTFAQTATPAATGGAALPLTGDRRAAFETYIAATLAATGVPGAAVAVIQDGAVVYLQGFGVKEVGTSDPVTPDTLMRLGSVTQPMTSLLAAALVDEGRATWDTPVVDLLPGFALADPALTARLTLADLFCACTGVPRRDFEFAFNSRGFGPEQLIASAAALPITAPFGQMYQYSDQMVAIGGYAAAAAAVGGASGDLYDAYAVAMQERVLGPIGMPRSTFALTDVLADGDYSASHLVNLAGQSHPLPLQEEDTVITAEAPAGALWSSAREMARFVQTELAAGVAPDGTRVVSAENLAVSWAPRVAIPADPNLPPVLNEATTDYGLDWMVGAYQGHRLISHGGNTFGFSAQVAFLPESDLGLVVLTNGGPAGLANAFIVGVQFRLLELLFDQTPEIEALLTQFIAVTTEGNAQVLAQLAPVDPAAVAPDLGRYVNPALGEVTVALRGGRLLFDAGEVWLELRPVAPATGVFLFYDGPIGSATDTLTFQAGADGRPTMVMTVGELTYTFEAVAPAATPVP